MGEHLGEGAGIALGQGFIGVVGSGVIRHIHHGHPKGLLDGGAGGGGDTGIGEQGGQSGDGGENAVTEVTDENHAINRLAGE